MITITINKTTKTEYQERTNYLVKETPTEIVEEGGYGSKKEVQKIKEYKTELEPKTKTETVNLLTQQIEDEAKFDLGKVILAINGVGQ